MTPPPTYARVVAIHDRISRDDAADLLGVSLVTLDRYIKRDLVIHEKNDITQRVWLSRADVQRLRAEREGEK